MGYHAAIAPALAAWAGLPPNDPPHITCDTCGDRIDVVGRRGPHAWFMNQRNPPGTGWVMRWPDDGTVQAWCPKCSHMAPRPKRKRGRVKRICSDCDRSPRPEPQHGDDGSGDGEGGR